MFDLTLSFDNGPEPDVTPAVLAALAARDIRTTFFVIGSKLQDPERRALSERAREEGHWIGNHTYTHSVPLGERPEPDIAAHEIGRTEALIGDLAHPSRLFRPFGGGGNLDKRLLRGPSSTTSLKTDILASCGTPYRGIGMIQTAGSNALWTSASRRLGR